MSPLGSLFAVDSPCSVCTSTVGNVIGPGAVVKGIPSLPLRGLRLQTFYAFFVLRNISLFLPSRVIAPLFLWSSSSIFRSLWTILFLRNLIRSFELEHPHCPIRPSTWDLVKVLQYLRGPVFEPLPTKSLHVVTMKVAIFLLWRLLNVWANCRLFLLAWCFWARISPSPIFLSL